MSQEIVHGRITPTTSARPKEGSPADVIRGLVLALGGLTSAEADMLLRVLEQLELIEAQEGPAAALEAARRVRAAWLDGEARRSAAE